MTVQIGIQIKQKQKHSIIYYSLYNFMKQGIILQGKQKIGSVWTYSKSYTTYNDDIHKHAGYKGHLKGSTGADSSRREAAWKHSAASSADLAPSAL